MIGAIIGVFVLLVVLAAVVPVLGAVAIAGAVIMAALFAVGIVMRIVGGTIRVGFGISQMVTGLVLSVLGLLLLLGVFGAIGAVLLKLWPLLLIGFGIWWMVRRD